MNTRTREVTWQDPHASAARSREMSGIDYLRGMIEGEIPRPPMAMLMNFGLAEISEGEAIFNVEPAEFHYNPIGLVHGGLAATLLDSAMGCAVHSMLPAGVAYTTLEMKLNYVRALSVDTGTVRCEGKVIHMGARTATAEGRIIDAKGKLYAHGTTTCLITR